MTIRVSAVLHKILDIKLRAMNTVSRKTFQHHWTKIDLEKWKFWAPRTFSSISRLFRQIREFAFPIRFSVLFHVGKAQTRRKVLSTIDRKKHVKAETEIYRFLYLACSFNCFAALSGHLQRWASDSDITDCKTRRIREEMGCHAWSDPPNNECSSWLACENERDSRPEFLSVFHSFLFCSTISHIFSFENGYRGTSANW